MKRRGNSEGSIRQRPDGRWETMIRLPGNQRKHFYGETQTLARSLLVGVPGRSFSLLQLLAQQPMH